MGSIVKLSAASAGGAGRTGVKTMVGLPLLAVLLVAGCNRPHGDDVVATVNGHSIMRADMDRMYKMQLGQAQAQGARPATSRRRRLTRPGCRWCAR